MASVFVGFDWDDFDRIAKRVVELTAAARDAFVDFIQSVYELEPKFFDWCGSVAKSTVEIVVRDYAIRVVKKGISWALDWLRDFLGQAFLF
jgi:hypothetical protein